MSDGERASSFSDWYNKNRDEHNENRRQKYAKNAALRKKARQRAKEYRQRIADGSVELTRTITRVVGDKEVVVYSSGQVANMLQCSAQLIRNWEDSGYMPTSMFDGVHRFYTARQVDLLRLLKAGLKKYRGDADGRGLQKIIDIVWAKWEKV